MYKSIAVLLLQELLFVVFSKLASFYDDFDKQEIWFSRTIMVSIPFMHYDASDSFWHSD